MAVKFQPKAGKPHISIIFWYGAYFWWPCKNGFPVSLGVSDCEPLIDYCVKANPEEYKTKGEAARALHYGSANK